MNEQMQNVPFVQIADALDPASTFFEDCLRQTASAPCTRSRATRRCSAAPAWSCARSARTVEDMAVATQSGLKLSLASAGGGRLQQIASCTARSRR